jgi:hypothetical protein
MAAWALDCFSTTIGSDKTTGSNRFLTILLGGLGGRCCNVFSVEVRKGFVVGAVLDATSRAFFWSIKIFLQNISFELSIAEIQSWRQLTRPRHVLSVLPTKSEDLDWIQHLEGSPNGLRRCFR